MLYRYSVANINFDIIRNINYFYEASSYVIDALVTLLYSYHDHISAKLQLKV